MARQDPLLKHAITAPAFERNKLHRERLVDAIHANVPRKLIAIAAPPGYGKTTLLADFHNNTDLPVCWVRLSEADQDLMRLADILRASLQRRLRRLRGLPDLEALVGATPTALARAFAAAIEDRIGESFVIVLDDVHLINRSRPVIEFLDAFLEVQPEQVTVVAAGREVLSVSLARLMAEGDLAGFGPHDLALTQDELVELARLQRGADIDAAEASRLLEETRGWVTGVLLSGNMTSVTLKGLLQDSPPMVYEYLASVVLNRQPDDLRRFMLDSSVLPVMTAEACDEVLKRTDSSRFLARLVHEGSFVTATAEAPRSYEYHPQFRSFLLFTLEGADPARQRGLRLRAAAYYGKGGAVEDSVRLYLEADAARQAAGLAEKHALAMYRAGRVKTLEEWATRLEAAGAEAPRIALCLSMMYSDQGRLDQAQATLDRLRKMGRASWPAGLPARIEIHQGWIHLLRGQFPDALEAAGRAASLLAKGADRRDRGRCLRVKAWAMFKSGGDLAEVERLYRDVVSLLSTGEDGFALAHALMDLYAIEVALGKPLEAYSIATRAHSLFAEIGAPHPLAISFNNLALEAHARGRYEEALEVYGNALKCARQAGAQEVEATILLGQADLFADLGLTIQAAELYGQALTIATQIDNVDLLRYGCVQTSALHRRGRGLAVAIEWLKRALALDEGKAMTSGVRVQLASLEIASSPERALQSLQGLLEDDRVALDAQERARALYFVCKAALARGDIQAALEALAEVLSWCGTRGVEQVAAAELAADDSMREFARRHAADSPAFSVIVHRIEGMKAVADRYQEAPASAEATSLELLALGQTSIRLAGRPAASVKPLAREVLFFLADHQRVERDVLVETFWPALPPGRQTANLHMTVYSLRRTLGKEVVQLEGAVYCLNPEVPVDYDVARFERASTVAERLPPGDPRRLFALTEAINSYRGTFMPDVASGWVEERRRALEVRYLDLLTANADEALVRDQPLRAVNTLRQALEIDPLRDDVNQRYLEALGRLGRRSEIVSHYQEYVRLLSDELGLDPPESVRALYARLIS